MSGETSALAPLAVSKFLLIDLIDGVIIVLGGLATLSLFELRLVDLADYVVIFIDDRVRAFLRMTSCSAELLPVALEVVLCCAGLL